MNHETKNKNILNRFEAKEGGARSKAFRVELIDGTKMTVVDLNYESIESVVKSTKNKFGERLKSVTEA
jgi:hypothetical protein